MIGDLRPDEIDAVLRHSSIGRIGCHSGGRTYVVPVAYAYDGADVYGHTREGLKLRFMRANPQVCFEVEQIENMGNWQTVIAWGAFEELTGEAARTGMELLVTHLSPLLGVSGGEPSAWLAPLKDTLVQRALQQGVVFRLRLGERTGRYEKTPPAASTAALSLGYVPEV
jgi:nitroimidazol reductase NimA-like FMN-containing flavoprotein (pyridoxamine 5'-phosphate oxidase superfamily)